MSCDKQDDNTLIGTAGNDRLNGGLGNDILIGGGGNDYLDGGPGGIDTAVYSGNFADYKISFSAGPLSSQGYVITVVDTRPGSPDGTDTLRRIEIVQFADGQLVDGQFYPSGLSAQVTAITALSTDTGASNTDFITSQAAQTVAGTFSGTLRAGDVIQISANGGTTWVNATTSGNTWSATGVTLAPGSGSLLTRTVDSAGHTLAGATHSYVLDTVVAAPSLIAAYVDTGASATDHITNATTATLSGTAEAGATVKLYDGATLIATVTANSSGAWSYNAASLANGTHSFTAAQTDLAGNVSAASPASSMTVDTVAPTVVPTLSVSFTDTGASHTDHITSATSAALTGVAEKGTLVNVYDGATLLATVTANASTGAWGYTATGLTDGTHSFTAREVDVAGNAGPASTASSMTVDTVAAAPSLVATFVDTGVSATDNITSATKATLSGTAEAGATVKVYDGATLIATVAANSSGTWSYNVTGLANGPHSFTATQTDIAGNVSAPSAADMMTVDTVVAAPSLIATYVDTGVSATDHITNATTATLSGTAEAGATVKVYDGATLISTVTANSSGAWSYNAASLANGTHSFTATQIDLAGNVSAASPASSMTVDTVAPTVVPTLSVSFTDTGASHTDHITSATSAALTGVAEKGALVNVYDGATLLATVTANASTGAWSYTATGLADGAHSFAAREVDVAGNIGSASTASSMVVDTLAIAAITTPIMVDGIINAVEKSNVTIGGTTTGVEAGRILTVSVSDGVHAAVTGSATVGAGGAWSISGLNVSGLNNGSLTVSVNGNDLAGNTASASTTVTLDTITPAAPSLSASFTDTGVSNADGITSATTAILSGVSEKGATVQVYDGTRLIATAAADAVTGAWTYTATNLANGAHDFNATATDLAGNKSAASGHSVMRVDTIAPVTPAFTTMFVDSGVNHADGITNANTATVSGTAERGATVVVYDGTTPIATIAANAITGAWTYNVAGLANGAHNFAVSQMDIAGNVSALSAAVSMTVETSASVAVTAPIMGTGVINAADNTNVTIAGTTSVELGQTLTVAVSDIAHHLVTGTATVGADGAWSASGLNLRGLTDGTLTVNVSGTDLAGNQAVASAAVTLDTFAKATLNAPIMDNGIINAAGETNVTIAGTTAGVDAGQTLSVTVSDTAQHTVSGTATVGAGGAWSVSGLNVSGLNDGLLTVSVSGTDSAGNPASASATVSLDSFVTAPGVALVNDTGVSIHDNITHNDALMGTAEAGATVTVVEGAAVLGTTTADGLGAWGLTPSLADGLHTLTVTQTDIAGNVSAATTLTFTLDTAPPAPTITGVSDIAGTLIGYGTAEAGSTVTVHDGSTSAVLGTTIADSNGAWTVNFGSGSAPVSFTVTAMDLAGNSGSDPIAFTVPTTVTTIIPPTLVASALAPYVDSQVANSFSPQMGLLTADDRDTIPGPTPGTTIPTTLSYGVSGGAASTAMSEYNLADTGTYGTLYLNSSNGKYEYVPNSAAIDTLPGGSAGIASDNFTLTVSDSVGGAATTLLAINLTGANEMPVLSAAVTPPTYVDTAAADVFSPVTGHLTATDPDVGAQLSYSVSGGTGAASTALTGYNLAEAGTYGTLYVNSTSGAYTYVPNNAAINALPVGPLGIASDNFTLTVSAATLSDPSTSHAASQPLTINLSGANDAPTLTASLTSASYVDTVAADVFTAVAGQLTGNDVDNGAALHYSVSGGAGPAPTALAGYDLAEAGAYGTVYVNSTSGAYIYVPDNAAINALLPAAASDNFTLSVTDGLGGTAGQSLTINLTGANDASVISGVVPFNYTVGNPAALVAANLSLSDADGNYATSATVSVGAGYSTGNDVLSFNSALLLPGMTATYGNNGVLTITGAAPLAAYRSILDSVAFQTTTAGGRTISFTVFDGAVHSATVDTSNLSLDNITTTGIRLPGVSAGNASGFSVSGVGDFNGDGYADVIIGAPFAGASGHLAGSSYVVYGGPSGLGPVLPLSTLAGLNGFSVSGQNALDRIGFAVSSAGDVNGDGLSDLIIGAPYANNNGAPYDRSQFAGGAYVVFGHAANTVADINVSTLDGSNGFQIVGAAAGDTAGYSVSGAGDVNGDGFGDVIVGAPLANTINGQTGAAYVVFGHTGGFATAGDAAGVVNLAHLTHTQGFDIIGAAAGDWTGAKVAAAGDINGDGIGDLIIGTATPAGNQPSATAYVVFGTASGFGTIDPLTGISTVDLSTPGGTNGFTLVGAGTGPQTTGYGRQHYSVHTAADVNGDGFGDIIVGAPYATTVNGQTGAAYVVFGHAGGFSTTDPVSLLPDGPGTVNLTHLSPTQGFEIIGAATGDRAGYSVSAAGDVNGDGYGDLIIGAPSAQDNGGNSAGTSYVIFGKASGFGTYDAATHMNIVNLATLGGNVGFSISAVGPGNDSGYAVSAAGDVNGDGFADLLVGSSGATPAPYTTASGTTITPGGDFSGESYIIFGSKFIATTHTFVGVGGPGTSYTLQGTTADETFIGGQGNATMVGGGGVDSFSGGVGNDTIHLGAAGSPDPSFLKIDGGGGLNTLVLDGSNVPLDLTAPGIDGKIHNIDRIDLGASGNNSLVLNIHDVLNMSDNSNQLFVTGKAGDSVTSALQGWGVSSSGQVTDHGILYDSYTLGGQAYSQGMANLLIDHQLLVANGVHVS